ncbi:tyrosine-type recombinase/integrase [Alkaliphilus pronyensis]|uniref:Tyrosine-type recombinase/integrase n=1 Tax=Alkaliphilus pronyensis TaxID=1482732 RepID=A0A6I0F9V7_9FIRM|nr:tyrosine-type recombinase/integrase [Alkaliphilus pronyensis]
MLEILNKDELGRILSNVENIKHKAILYLVYSSGLRVESVVILKTCDINEDKKIIHVVQGKGRKDRYTLLSQVALDIVNIYKQIYEPEDWLFLGGKKEISLRKDQYKKYLREDVIKRR